MPESSLSELCLGQILHSIGEDDKAMDGPTSFSEPVPRTIKGFTEAVYLEPSEQRIFDGPSKLRYTQNLQSKNLLRLGYRWRVILCF